MKRSKEGVIAEKYWHIDNGGIMLTIKDTPKDDCGNFDIILSTSYFGYPAIEMHLNSSCNMDSTMLKEMADVFTKAALKIEEREQKLKEKEDA